MILEFEVHAGKDRRITDVQLGRGAESIDPTELTFDEQAGVQDAAVAHGARGI